jgi:glycine dehydrogenase subunit 1
MVPYLPHTDEQIREMLDTIGVSNVDELFADIPEPIRLGRELDLPEGVSEYEVHTRLGQIASRNATHQVSFLGCGSYDHIVPATVPHLAGRAEFATAYTPYQAEISQGMLQAIFEFQTMMAEITGLDVSNASLYDGHTAAAEAGSMALQSVRKSDTILYAATLHPHTKQVLRAHFTDMDVKVEEVAANSGQTDLEDLRKKLSPNVAVFIAQSPNIYGCVEDFTDFADALHKNGSLFAVSANPLSLALLKPAGAWGADIAVGDGQPFGIAPYFGGPSVGYIAATQKLLRRMPGRIVGQTQDADGSRAFVLTLQAREQHIKRERATSNICSNQALVALATTIYLSTMGREGLKEVAHQNLSKAHYLFKRIVDELPVRPLYDRPFFNEFTVVMERDVESVLVEMEKAELLGGIAARRLIPNAPANALIVAVTEKRTRAEMDRYVETLARILQ